MASNPLLPADFLRGSVRYSSIRWFPIVHGPETAQGCAHGTIIVRYRNLILIS
jgi:hypothetical protein